MKLISSLPILQTHRHFQGKKRKLSSRMVTENPPWRQQPIFLSGTRGTVTQTAPPSLQRTMSCQQQQSLGIFDLFKMKKKKRRKNQPQIPELPRRHLLAERTSAVVLAAAPMGLALATTQDVPWMNQPTVTPDDPAHRYTGSYCSSLQSGQTGTSPQPMTAVHTNDSAGQTALPSCFGNFLPGKASMQQCEPLKTSLSSHIACWRLLSAGRVSHGGCRKSR